MAKKGGLDLSRFESTNNKTNTDNGGGTYDVEELEKKEFEAKHSDIAEYAKIFLSPLEMEKLTPSTAFTIPSRV